MFAKKVSSLNKGGRVGESTDGGSNISIGYSPPSIKRGLRVLRFSIHHSNLF